MEAPDFSLKNETIVPYYSNGNWKQEARIGTMGDMPYVVLDTFWFDQDGSQEWKPGKSGSHLWLRASQWKGLSANAAKINAALAKLSKCRFPIG